MDKFFNFVDEATALSFKYPCFTTISSILALIGLFKLTTFSLSFISLVCDLVIYSPSRLTKYGAKRGNWAIITGASDGIGKEYAYQLASRGFNVGLVSRTESKLVELCKEIEDKYKGSVKAKYLAIDIATDADSNYTSLESFVKSFGAPVTALINNVGQSHSIPVTFLQTPDQEMQNIITINTTATLKITKVVAPHIQNAIQGRAASRGLILNMGSFAGLVPTPLLATYSGSKAFLQAWSIALARELEPSKIDVQLIESYLVISAMSKIRRSSLMIPRPKEFVKATLSTIGRRVGSQERYASNTPYWSHALLHFLLDSTIGVYSKLAVGVNYSTHVDIRKRALRKAAREAEKLTKDK